MWQMIAGTGLRCAECRHVIQPGRLCLSDLPEETPPGVDRRDFRHFCIGCPQCWAQGKHACYVRYLDSRSSRVAAPRSLPCARCGRRIGAGEKTCIDAYYDWPGMAVGERDNGLPAAVGINTAAASVDILIRGMPGNSFTDLGQSLQRKFAMAGLGGDRGVRSVADAQSFFQESIPYPVRNLSGDAVRQWLEGKDASHVRSVQNAPEMMNVNGNFVWEDSVINRARGAENMTGAELIRANASNAFDASAIVFRTCLESAAVTAFCAALMEAPVAVLENYIHYQKGRKTGEEALIDAARLIATRAAAGAVIGFAVTVAVALIPGAAPFLVTVAPVLMPVGFALYGTTVLKRIMDALADDLPLDRVGTYFCSSRCHTRFAYETGYSALMRWESGRVKTRA